MITCANCKSNQYLGTLFCGECGAPLTGEDGLTTQFIKRTVTNSYLPSNTPPPVIQPNVVPQARVLLVVQGTGRTLPLVGKIEYTLGRISPGQTATPDIDLTPFDGYKRGVSRAHASIRVQQKEVTLTDLGSANGTRLNGEKLPPNAPRPVQNGDTLALGKLKLQVVIRSD